MKSFVAIRYFVYHSQFELTVGNIRRKRFVTNQDLREGFQSTTALCDEITGQSPVGNIVLRYKICRHRLYTGSKGCRIFGVSGFRLKRRTNTFSVYEERAQLANGDRSF